MTDQNILSLSQAAQDKIIEIRDQEPGDEEYALLVEVTGIRGAQFAYELSFVPLDDCETTDHLDRHGELVIAVPGENVENLRGASLDLTAQGLAMDNPNSPSPAVGHGPVGELTGPLAEQVSQVLANHVNPAIAVTEELPSWSASKKATFTCGCWAGARVADWPRSPSNRASSGSCGMPSPKSGRSSM